MGRSVARTPARELADGFQRGQVEVRESQGFRVDAPPALRDDPSPRRAPLLEVAARHGHAAAAQREHPRRLETDAPTGAGDDRVPAGEVDALAHLLGGRAATESRPLPRRRGLGTLCSPTRQRIDLAVRFYHSVSDPGKSLAAAAGTRRST